MEGSAEVVIVAEEYPPFHGGIARHLSALCSVIAAERPVRLELWCRSRRALPPPCAGVEVIDRQERPLERLWADLVDHCRRRRPAAVVFGQDNHLRILPLWRLRRLGVPVYVLIHGREVTTVGPRGRLKRWPALASGVTAIANSGFTARCFAKTYPLIRFHIVYPGITRAALHTIPGPELRRGIVSVGRLVERKGFDVLIASVRRLHDSGLIVPLTICGVGVEKPRLLRMVDELRLTGSVTFLEGLADEEVDQLFDRHRVFCMLPRQLRGGDVEGFGIVFLEAAARGLPSVAGASGGVADAVSDGVSGMLVDPTDVDAVVPRLRSLLSDDDEWLRLSAGARQWAARFEWSRRRVADVLPNLFPES